MAPVDNPILGFVYFVIIINLFDTFYTAYSLNQTSLFPEMYQDLDQRAKANNFVAIFNIIGLLFAALIPTFFFTELLGYGTPAERAATQMGYITASIVMSILVAIFATIFILFGLKERKEYSKDPEQAPSFGKSIKLTFKNKAFKTYVIVNFAQWFIFGLVPIINPYFIEFIIGITTPFLQMLFLGVIFISAIFFMVIWKMIFTKNGAKKGHMFALGAIVVTLVPFLFISEIIGAIIAYILLGFGFAGIMFGRDVVMSAIIDYDEIESGIRREGSYYGVNALIIRLSTVAVAISVAIVFPTVGWATFEPSSVTDITRLAIRILMCVFPAVAIGLALFFFRKFPIDKEKYIEVKQKLEEIHSKKVESTR
jgi:GPH family glycoside/pentoside/hexuronide:cation symporter